MADFAIAAAQVASIRGDMDRNIATHASVIADAAKHGVTVLVFPELSLIGYEPELAAELAITEADSRLTPLLRLAQKHQLEIVMGASLQDVTGRPALGVIAIAADGATKTYRKMHLGGSELEYFTPGNTPLAFAVNGHTIGIAICADASQPSHPQNYADAGANIYAASVFLTDDWYATDAPRLAGYSLRHRMLIVMANHAASVGTYTSVGKSAVWSPDGALLAQADGTENALVIGRSNHAGWRGEVIKI